MKKIILILLFTSLNSTFSNEFEEFEDINLSKENNNIVVNGFLETEYGANKDSEQVLNNQKVRLKANKKINNVHYYGKIDVTNDLVDGTTYMDVRELRFVYRLTDFSDLSVGRQVSTWGVADMLFINDLFPKNWVANFQGRDMEMLKDPSNSVRLTSYFNKTVIDMVYQPEFTSDNTPSGCHFGVYSPTTNRIDRNDQQCGVKDTEDRDRNKENGEFAINVKQKVGNHELALYGYTGYYKSPNPSYSRLNVYGSSYEGQVGPGILTFESGFYDSLDDKDGNNLMIENSSFKYLVGYRQDLTSIFSYGLQFYQTKMFDYDAYENSFLLGNPQNYAFRKKEVQSTYTLRLTLKLQQETLWISLFSYLRPDDKDQFTKIEISKKLTDQFKITIGANIFDGHENYRTREFGMLKDDDNAFLRLNYSF